MTVRYLVKRVAPAAVESDLLRIWSGNLAAVGDARAKLQWSYHDAPERPEHVYVLAAGDDEQPPHVVGTAGIAIRRFASHHGELRVALGCDLAIDRPHRVVLPALRLVREVRRDTGAEFDLSYNFPNQHAHGLYARAGYHDLGMMTRYVKLLRAAPYIARVVRHERVAGIAGAVVDAASRAWLAIRTRRGASRFCLEWLDAVDGRFDQLWLAARDAYPIIGRRDASWVAWRCLASPHGRSRVAALVDRETNALRAYASVRTVDGVAHVGDLFGLPVDLDPLLALLAPALRDGGATSIAFRYLGSSRVAELLRSHGFHPRATDRHVYVAAGDAMTGSERARSLDAESWHLTDFDEDS